MPFNVNDFKNNLVFGGARPSLFEVQMPLPQLLTTPADGVIDGGATNSSDFTRVLTFMCRATSIPPSTIGTIEVPYFGRKVKVAGNRTFEAWSITVINDEDFLIRRGFETWMAAINGHSTNLKNSGVVSSPASYQVEAIVRQYGKGDAQNAIRTYKLQNVFPVGIGAIELSWDADNQIQEFTVQLEYDYWTVDGAPPAATVV